MYRHFYCTILLDVNVSSLLFIVCFLSQQRKDCYMYIVLEIIDKIKLYSCYIVRVKSCIAGLI